MKKRVERKIFLELEGDDAKIMVEILNYVWHRASKHETYVSRFKEKIEKIRDVLNDESDEFAIEDKEDVEVW